MALFQHDNILLPYQTQFAPFSFDLVLLQGSRFNADYWIPVLEDWKGLPGCGGRIVTLDWPPAGLVVADRVAFFARWIQTLGLVHLRVVACDDAVALIQELERDYPGVVDKSLVFPRNPPRGDELKRVVGEFCGVGDEIK